MNAELSAQDLRELQNEPFVKFISEHTLSDAATLLCGPDPLEIANYPDFYLWKEAELFFWHARGQPHFTALHERRSEEDVFAALNQWRKGPANQPEFNPAARLEALQAGTKPDSTSKPLLFYGPSGSGKSTVAAELWMMWAMEWNSSGHMGFTTGRQFCNSVSARAKASAIVPYMEQLQNLRWLILDDIGATKYTERCAEELLDLISARIFRYDLQTIITMNTDSRGLAERLEARDYHSGKATNASTVESILRRLRTDFQYINFSKATTESEA